MGLQAVAGGLKDSPQATTTFTVVDATVDYALDCDTDTDNAIADVLEMVILELIRKGILKGSVTTH